MAKCDIIIPIYNAYDCLQSCFDSVANNTDLSLHRVILINDKSTDPRVLPFLKDYVKSHSGFLLLENEQNLGFVGTVNRGMKFSENDVLLLNSDTEVTKNWLDNIRKCAYSEPRVATVTPLSNNATFASVPNTFEANELPKNISLSEMANFVEKCSFVDYPEVPTGHGFCLYIKRSVLEEIGYFDEETYGKGYGEENDFCFRCLDAGYRHLICDNAFVLHKESQSFSKQKDALIAQGLDALEKKYPEYKKKLDQWCVERHLEYVGQNISLAIGAQSKVPNILIVIHDWKNIKTNLGGTSLHVWDIVRMQRDKFNFHVLCPEDGNYKLYSYWSKGETETTITFPKINSFSAYPFYNSEYKKMVSEIIQIFKIQLIHIHHLIDHYFDIIEVAKQNNIITIMTLHDYYAACPLINKLYQNKCYCRKGSDEQCEKCLTTKFKIVERSNKFIKAWRAEWERFLNKVDILITPSQASKDEILMTYPNLNILVMEHGVDYPKIKSTIEMKKNDVLDVAFVGAIGIHKGSRILLDLIKSKKMKNIRIHLFGIIDTPSVKNNKHFINHGRYKREELPELLKKNNIKLICLFSTWPETFSYTLTESVASGIPVLAFDFGAIAERIKKYHLGWVISHESTTSTIIEKLNEIHQNEKAYKDVIKSINKYEYKNTKKMAQEYQKLYLKKIVKPVEEIDLEKIKALVKSSKRTNINITYTNYEWVFSTLKWKIISKFKLPKGIKHVVRKIIKND